MKRAASSCLATSLAVFCAGCGDDGPGASGGVGESTTDADTMGTGGRESSGTSTTHGGVDDTTGATSLDETTDTENGTTGDSTGSETTGGVCPEGEQVCIDNQHMVCDGEGGYDEVQDCGTNVCVPELSCVDCVPGARRCVEDAAQVCNEVGQWELDEECDGLQGVTCDENLGQCVGACSAGALGQTYIGCDYYPTVTQQHDSYNTAPTHQFVTAVANTSAQAAEVTVTQGDTVIAQVQVAPEDVGIIALPWVNALTKGNGPSVLVPEGAYRLRSDQPVTVYQYNPLAATTTNDASLLLPVNAWGKDYVVAAWPHWSSYPGFYAVTASRDGTVVDLLPSATGGQVQAGGGVAADGTGQVTLNRGDVLEVMTVAGSDVTGTLVTASEPVQVIGGHACTNVPANISACDHLEDSLFPIDTLTNEYIVVPPVQVPNDHLPKAQIVRIIATQADTNLVVEPDQGVSNHLVNAGDFVQTGMTTDAFTVTADKKVLVAQYMVGQSAGYGTSDPSIVQAVPSEQFRSDYLFHAAPSWTANYVDIVAPTGANVTVDGVVVPDWAVIGATGFSVAHVQLSNAGNGNHRLVSNEPVGISVYGVQSAGSYWYPGGLDLTVIPQ
jgi:hypothetical protein